MEVQTVELAINALNEELNSAPSDGIDEEGKNPFVSANLFCHEIMFIPEPCRELRRCFLERKQICNEIHVS